jgi:uncharacterized membrane protein
MPLELSAPAALFLAAGGAILAYIVVVLILMGALKLFVWLRSYFS